MVGLLIAAGVVVILILWVVATYNGFVKGKLLVEDNFSQIKIQCKKRYDLVPNLVETVKGYATHEKETLDNVISARNKGSSANNPAALAEADGQFARTLGRLFALGEAYPDLKANANFAALQSELSGLEKAIAAARQFYNDSVLMYNRKIMVFPNNILAGMFRFDEAGFFDAPDAEIENVQVSF